MITVLSKDTEHDFPASVADVFADLAAEVAAADEGRGEARGVLAGVQIQPRPLGALAYAAGFRDAAELVTCVAVCLSESQGYSRAYNDNLLPLAELSEGQVVRNVETLEPYTVVDPARGILRYQDGSTDTFPTTVLLVVSRDVGPMQINIPASQITTSVEAGLYDAPTNFSRARALYDTQVGGGRVRGFTPWVGFTSGVYLHDTYLKRAARGFGNWGAQLLLDEQRSRLPDYETGLVQNVLEYGYRMVAMVADFVQIGWLAADGLRGATSPPVIDDLQKIKAAAADGRAWARR